MTPLRNIPIKSKLAAITMLTSGVALLLACAAFVVYERMALEIVSVQQSYSKVSGVKEMLNPVDLVEDAVRMNTGAFQRHEIEVVREFGQVPPVNSEKHKTLQILINLLRNAKYACSESGRNNGRVTLRVGNGGATVRISVSDNGVGIAPENMTRIFAHGFTTRRDGHGFGLHSGALAARELGGSLQAFSEGPGRGATFILELPLDAEAAPSRIDRHLHHSGKS